MEARQRSNRCQKFIRRNRKKYLIKVNYKSYRVKNTLKINSKNSRNQLIILRSPKLSSIEGKDGVKKEFSQITKQSNIILTEITIGTLKKRRYHNLKSKRVSGILNITINRASKMTLRKFLLTPIYGA